MSGLMTLQPVFVPDAVWKARDRNEWAGTSDSFPAYVCFGGSHFWVRLCASLSWVFFSLVGCFAFTVRVRHFNS